MFLPEDYKSPKSSSNYMKLNDGENKFRILSAPIYGWEDWLDKKPVRYRMEDKPSKSIDPTKPIKHFWAMIVWNYTEEQVQILQITQASIRDSIENMSRDPEWGLPYFYDIKVFKKGEGKDTKYAINPAPPKQLNPEVEIYFKEKPCNLEALFTSEDPFSQEHMNYTPGIFSEGDLSPMKDLDVEGYLASFGKEKDNMKSFLEKVCATRKWTEEKAIEEFKKNSEDTLKKFNDWKKAQKVAA